MTVLTKEITIAHSPDSDDAFMFYALANNKLDTKGLKIHQVLKDIQSLNIEAMNGKYEVSAISFASYPQVCDKYALMPCGASMGLNYGPMVVSKTQLSKADLANTVIAIPGKLTSAYLTLRLWEANVKTVEMPFDQILEAVHEGKVQAGLIIHEGQLTYQQLGLTKIVDLGEWWYEKTKLPLPLGGNIVRKDLGAELIQFVTKLLQDAIKYSLSHRSEALAYAMQYARDLKQEEADKFVGMYVNELTVDYGDQGRAALTTFFEMAYKQGIIDKPVELDFVKI
jgi:1,4-dihydroxy-6-naphthoate synthase